ncbi:hypothetical protein QUF99_11105 [Bacillus sp. DX4.1]|uniref:hypothetical protein n=1 Tax=Bacillus sp. DX4.1 TaxID=3055867 RepID=UPI0025A07656|nr:hypothetical protein [Bacillus sp. DX4.1]MDM5187857.1 hypothetical protein [Bacillus sp. DX4.1]
MNLSNIEQVNVKIVLENGDGTTVECIEKGVKISDTLVLSVYEAGVSINEFHYDQTGDIVLGDEILDLQGVVNDSAIDLEAIGNMSALDFLLKIAAIKRDLH